MKTLKWLVLTMLFGLTQSQLASGQEVNDYEKAGKLPEYPGGQDAFKAYLAENISWPAEARAVGAQGKVYISFTVDKKGKIKDAEITRGVHTALDAEALRVVQNMPDWQAGEKDGEQADVRLTVPVAFALSPDKNE